MFSLNGALFYFQKENEELFILLPLFKLVEFIPLCTLLMIMHMRQIVDGDDSA